MEHRQHDVFLVKWRNLSLNAEAFLSFAPTPDVAIREGALGTGVAADRFSFEFQDLRLTPHQWRCEDAMKHLLALRPENRA